MRLSRIPIELVTALYVVTYLPYMLITRQLSVTDNAELGRPLTGLESLPPVLIMGTVLTFAFTWASGWWRSAHLKTVGPLTLPTPTRWTFLSGIGTSLLLFTVPLSLTFEGVSIPFMQLLMRGDVLVIAPLVDLAFGRKVRWYNWVALVLVAIGMALTIKARGGLHLPPLAIATVILYTFGYFTRLAVMTKVAKQGGDDVLKGYYVEEKMVAMPLSVFALWVVTVVNGASQGTELGWGFTDVWTSSAMPLLIVLTIVFVVISVIAALILLNPRENSFCVPFERAGSVLAGMGAAYILAFGFGQPFPTVPEVIGASLLVSAILLLSFAPRFGRTAAVAA